MKLSAVGNREVAISEPSIAWREIIAPDEDARHQAAARIIAEIQKARRARFGVGRALHRKSVLALRASFEVLPDLPEFAHNGLFASPRRYDALVRLSNGGMDIQSNTRPDIRGFAISVLGVQGAGALGVDANRQDFLLINQDSFSSATSAEFVKIVEAASKGQAAVLVHFIRTFGLLGGLGRLRTLAGALGKPFAGFAGEAFNSVAPIACGPYAARVLLEPRLKKSRGSLDPVDDMRARLAAGPIDYDVKLQFFVDEKSTPIEDASIVWPADMAPVVTVARLTLKPEPEDLTAREALVEAVEKFAFDPWAGLAAHRPLGEIMRARKVAYFASQKGRGAA